ncbi:hypothetical protein BH11CYA1_BH11CYA1_33550 [soil metagenome]
MGEKNRERATSKNQEQVEGSSSLVIMDEISLSSALKTRPQCKDNSNISCLPELQIINFSPLKDLSNYGKVRFDQSGKAEIVGPDMQTRFSYGPNENETFKWSGNQLMEVATADKTFSYDSSANIWRIKNNSSPLMSRQDGQSSSHDATFSLGVFKKTYELSGPVTLDRLYEQYQAFLAEAAPVNTYLTPEKVKELKEEITKREGAIPYAYLDTVKVPTACVGVNLNRTDVRKRFEELGVDFDRLKKDAYVSKQNKSVFLTDEQMDKLLDQDLTDSFKQTLAIYPNFASHPKAVQDVMIDLTFNMGPDRLRKFKNMNQALNQNDYATAASCLQNSEYIRSGQTGWRGESNLKSIQLAAANR